MTQSNYYHYLFSDFVEVFAKLSECWRKVDKSIADKYHQLAIAERQNYDKELKNYKASLSLDEKSEIEKDKKQKRTEKRKEKRVCPNWQLHALGMPKRPANAYILFSQDYMKKSPDRSPDAYFKESSKLAETWANLPEKEKSKWEELAASHAKEYKKKLAEWESEMTSKGHLEVVHTKGKDKGAKV
ncbi:hypothetical protein ONE63_002385 [Megalurothrips usitatus]|uniref:HMG box domain-containing protein n=1 Tax=Megalurothrips usitatus TaxID=439358 RepID=A0AAV7XE40_9NEOP|nr:hypothetical protein ONE63_002385 [Megalurothrips usitatus]